MTGNAGTSSSIAAAQRSSYGQWPPTSITNIPQATRLPRYTPTGAEPNYPATLVTPLSSVSTGPPKACDWYTSINGCSYMNVSRMDREASTGFGDLFLRPLQC